MTTYFTGTKTESVGQNITQLCPAFDTRIPVLDAVSVTTGASSQDLYICSALGIFETSRYTKDGDTTTQVFDTSPGAAELKQSDYVVAINDRGRFELLQVDSVSGDTITWQTGPAEDLPIRTLMYSYYHPFEDQLKFPALEETAFQPYVEVPANGTYIYRPRLQAGRDVQVDGVTTSVRAEGTPMLIVLRNETAQATLDYCQFSWVSRDDDFAVQARGTAAKADPGPVQEGD